MYKLSSLRSSSLYLRSVQSCARISEAIMRLIKKILTTLIRAAMSDEFKLPAKIFCTIWVLIFVSAGLYDVFSQPPGPLLAPPERGLQDDVELKGRHERSLPTLGRNHNYPGQTAHSDFTYYSLFDARHKTVYTNRPQAEGQVLRKPSRRENFWFTSIQKKAAGMLGQSNHTACYSVRYRLLEGRGVEQEVTCEFNGEVFSVSMLEPMAPTLLMEAPRVQNKLLTLNIILTLTGRQESFNSFLQNLLSVASASTLPIILTVVYFEDGQSQAMRDALATVANRVPNLFTEYMLDTRAFSRGRGLREGLLSSGGARPKDSTIVWFTDVDVGFTQEFINRCTSTPVLGKQVFFPIVWSEYNPKLHRLAHPHPGTVEALNDAGYWRIYGYGMVCGFMADFLNVADALAETSSSWGGEDLSFFRRLLATNQYKLIRSLEPGLIHHYHPKDCSGIADRILFAECIKMQIINEASQFVFGHHYFSTNDN